MSSYPEFTVFKVKEDEGSLTVFGSIDRTVQGKEKWIDDGWVGTLFKNNKIAFGRWHKDNDLWKFKFDDDGKRKFHVLTGDVLSAIGGYWGERIEIVLDDEIRWEEANFHTKGQSDHDHCAICWATISEFENTIYFFGNTRYPVCLECYCNHVKIRDVSFVPNDA